MKTILKITAFSATLLILVMGLTSCRDKENPPYTAECGKFHITNTEFVSWCIIPFEVSNNSTNKVKFENRTGSILTHRAPFSVEYFNGENWEYVRHNAMIHWVGCEFRISPGETIESYKSLYWWVEESSHKHRRGKYRIVRHYTLHSADKDTVLTLYAEFVVK